MAGSYSVAEEPVTNIQLGIFLPTPLNGRKAKKLSGTVDADHSKKKLIAKSAGKSRERKVRLDSRVDGYRLQLVEAKKAKADGDKLLPSEGTSGSSKKRKRPKRKQKQSKISTLKAVVDIESALDYLHKWDRDISMWTFRKKTQYWLLQNACDKSKVVVQCTYFNVNALKDAGIHVQVPKVEFKILLRYMEALKGNQRQMTVARAQGIVEKYQSAELVSERMHKRALKILKVLL